MRRRTSKHIRKLHIDGAEWRYRIGRAFVELWSPGSEHRSGLVSFSDLLGKEEAAHRAHVRMAYLESRWVEKNYRGFSVFPKDVVAYIRAT